MSNRSADDRATGISYDEVTRVEHHIAAPGVTHPAETVDQLRRRSQSEWSAKRDALPTLPEAEAMEQYQQRVGRVGIAMVAPVAPKLMQLQRASSLVARLKTNVLDRSAWQGLRDVLLESQNGPPDGDADGSIAPGAWSALQDFMQRWQHFTDVFERLTRAGVS